jgi:hypothetical protein
MGIDLIGLDLEHVARRSAPHHLIADGRAQPGDVRAERLRGTGRRPPRPELFDQLVGGRDPIGA